MPSKLMHLMLIRIITNVFMYIKLRGFYGDLPANSFNRNISFSCALYAELLSHILLKTSVKYV